MEPMLSLAGVELYYDHVYALKGVSIDLEKGETVALIGANGAGKSSILRAITPVSTGSARARSLSRAGASTVSTRRRSSSSASPWFPRAALFPLMSVRDNLMMGSSRAPMQRACALPRRRAASLSPPQGQAASGGRNATSGGEQQIRR